MTDRPEDLDVVGIDEDPLEAAVCVFHVRRGRIVGRRAFVVDKVEELTRPQLVGRVLEELYGDAEPAAAPARRRRAGAWWRQLGVDLGRGGPGLVGHRGGLGSRRAPAGARARPPRGLPRSTRRSWPTGAADRVALRVPQRGGKRTLLQTVTRNAGEELARHRLRRASDHDSRARALESLREVLGLPQAPLRIECYDMSHLQGTDYVGSMVVLEDGLPRKSEYRRFKIRDVPGNDDYAAMEEVLTRRLTALLEARAQTGGEDATSGSARARRFAYPPQLLLLDGGKGQLGVGVRVLERLGLSEEIPVAALAKTFEEVYVPGRADPVPDAAGVRRPVPPAAGARRGAPVRRVLPP